MSKINTKLGNDRPGMIDYMIWPWFERRPVIQLTHPGAVDYAKLGENTKAIVRLEKIRQN